MAQPMDVLPANVQPTTKAGKPRLRIKWTILMNSSIIRNYLRITRLETNTTGYRFLLHRAFTADFPDIVATEQRIADQRRVILKK